MADVSVQIDIHTLAAKENLTALVAELGKVENSLANLGKSAGRDVGTRKALNEQADAFRDFNRKILELQLANANSMKSYTSALKNAVKEGLVGAEEAAKSFSTAFKSDAFKRELEDNERAAKRHAKALKDAAKEAAEAGRGAAELEALKVREAITSNMQIRRDEEQQRKKIFADLKADILARSKEEAAATSARIALVKQETAELERMGKTQRSIRDKLNFMRSDGGVVYQYNALARSQNELRQATQIKTAASSLGFADHTALFKSVGDGSTSFDKLERAMSHAGKTANGFRGYVYELSKATQLMDGPLGGVAYRISLLGDILAFTGGRMILAVGTIATFGTALVKLVSSANEMRAVTGFLKNVTDSTAEYETAITSLIEISKNQYTALDSTVKFYGRLANATKEVGISQTDLLKVTETLAAGFRLNMASAGEASSVMMQFTQALGSGRLQGDEFRSMAENASVVMTKLAKAILGPSGTIPGLRAMAAQGELTTDIIVPAMAQINAEVVAAAEKMPPTIGQAMTKLGTSFDEMAINSRVLNGAIDLIATSLAAFANNLPAVTNAVLAASAAVASLMLPTAFAGLARLLPVVAGAAASAAAGITTVATAVAGATTVIGGLRAGITATIALLPPVRIAFAALTVAAGAFAALQLADSFKNQKDAIESAVDSLVRARTRVEEINATMAQHQVTLGGVSAATEDWAHMSIEQINAIMLKDRVFTEAFVANAKIRFGTEAMNLTAQIESLEAKKTVLASDVAASEQADRIARALGAPDGAVGVTDTKAQKEELLKVTEELIAARKQKVALETNINKLQAGLQGGTAAGAEQYKKSKKNIEEQIEAFRKQGSAAKYATEEVQKWKEKNQLPVNASAQDRANLEASAAEIKKAAMEEYAVKEKLGKLESAASNATKGRTSELAKQEALQERVNLLSSTSLTDYTNKVDEQRTLNDLVRANGGDIEAATLQYEVQKAQNDYLLDVMKKKGDVSSQEVQTVKEKIAEKAKELEKEKQISEELAENRRKAIALADTLERSISDGIYSGFTDGMSGFFDSLKSTFLRGIADSIASSMRGQLSSSIGGLFGVPNATGLGGSGSAVGALSNISSLSSLMSLGNNLLNGSLLPSGATAVLNNIGSSVFGIGGTSLQREAFSAFSQAGMQGPQVAGLGDKIAGQVNPANMVAGFAGSWAGSKVFGDSKYGGVTSAATSTTAAIAAAQLGLGPIGAASLIFTAAFGGQGLGKLISGPKPNPASVFRIDQEGEVGYGAKHISDEFAKGTYSALSSAFASLQQLTGKDLLKGQEIMGGYDRGSAFFSLGDYKKAGVPIVKFDSNDSESANAAVGKLAAMIAGQNTELAPEISNALSIIAKSSDTAIASLEAVAFALNFNDLGEPEKKISDVEQAMIDLNKKFDDAVKMAKDLELAESRVEEMRQKTLATLREGFNSAALSTVTGIIDPRFAAVTAENERYKSQMSDARAIGGNTSVVELLHQLNMIQIEAQYVNEKQLELANEQLDAAQNALNLWDGLPQSLAKSIADLSLSDLSTLSPQEKVAEARRQYESLFAASRDLSNPEAAATAAGELASAGSTLLELAKAYYASSTDYASIYSEVVMGLGDTKTLAEREFDIAKSSYDELKAHTELLQQLASSGVNGSYANANATLIGLRGVLSDSQFAAAEGVIASATPGVIAGGDRRTKYLDSNAAANAAAVQTLRALGIPGFANGGYVTGGISGMDSIPALLMPGERVLNQQQARAYAANDGAQVAEMREMRKQMAQMQAHIASLVELTAEGNETRKRSISKAKAAANG